MGEQARESPGIHWWSLQSFSGAETRGGRPEALKVGGGQRVRSTRRPWASSRYGSGCVTVAEKGESKSHDRGQESHKRLSRGIASVTFGATGRGPNHSARHYRDTGDRDTSSPFDFSKTSSQQLTIAHFPKATNDFIATSSYPSSPTLPVYRSYRLVRNLRP